jgi:hypothetical protein
MQRATYRWKLLVMLLLGVFDALAAVMFAVSVTSVPIVAVNIVAVIGFFLSMWAWGTGVVFMPPTFALFSRLTQQAYRQQRLDDTTTGSSVLRITGAPKKRIKVGVGLSAWAARTAAGQVAAASVLDFPQ